MLLLIKPIAQDVKVVPLFDTNPHFSRRPKSVERKSSPESRNMRFWWRRRPAGGFTTDHNSRRDASATKSGLRLAFVWGLAGWGNLCEKCGLTHHSIQYSAEGIFRAIRGKSRVPV